MIRCLVLDKISACPCSSDMVNDTKALSPISPNIQPSNQRCLSTHFLKHNPHCPLSHPCNISLSVVPNFPRPPTPAFTFFNIFIFKRKKTTMPLFSPLCPFAFYQYPPFPPIFTTFPFLYFIPWPIATIFISKQPKLAESKPVKPQ